MTAEVCRSRKLERISFAFERSDKSVLKLPNDKILKSLSGKICLLVSSLILVIICFSSIYGQTTPQGMTSYFSPGTGGSTSTNYLKNSAAFRQEIMRMEINVVRGAQSLPITQVPRVQKDDVIKMKLLDEAVGGIKPNESYWDWTFLVAFVNPNRRSVKGQDKQYAVSQEIRFKKTGWYKQYSFQVPYDSQPVFFLYPKPKYRDKILKVVTRNYNEVRKLGEKTIEIAGAYAQISSFLNELQYVLYQTQMSRYYNTNGVPGFGGGSYYSSGNNNGTGSSYNPYGSTSTSNPYGSSSTYNPYGTSSPSGSTSTYNPYNPYNPTATPSPTPNNQQQKQKIEIPVNYNYLVEQTIERMARSFNLQLPSCWGTGSGGYGSYGSSSGSSYGSTYGGSTYGSTYGSYGSSSGSYGSYGAYGSSGGYGNQNNFGYAVSQELFARAQCVAKNIRLEDFDLSVASMLQQGGLMLATHLRDKYPQLSYWINLAAAAIDFIVKVFQKAALRIVPTIVQASDGSGSSSSGSYQTSYATQSGYTSSSYGTPGATSSYSPNLPLSYSPTSPAPAPSVKISLYAESQPDNSQFVTAYPVVVHKWQAEPDPEVISIPPPVLAEPCLHAGVNLLKNTSIGEEPEADTFTKDFKLTMTSSNGFKKEFPLKKNVGLGGWELNLTKEDLNSFPKIEMTLESQISGTRGFNEIKSPVFTLPLSLGGNYEVTPESQKSFAVGGKRIVTIRNPLGGCQCLQAVIYKPSFGGQFVYEASSKDRNNQLQYSPDGKEVSFEIDAGGFQPGTGQLTLITYGGESANLNLKLYPLPPNIANVKMARGDNQAIITGERLEQLQSVKINGRRASVAGNQTSENQGQGGSGNSNQSLPNQTQSGYPNQGSSINQSPQTQSSYGNPGVGVYPNQAVNPVPNSSQQSGYPNNPAQPVNPNQSVYGNTGRGGNGSQPSIPSPTPVPAQTPNSLNTYSPAPANAYPPAASAPNPVNIYSSSPLNANERLVVFDDLNAKLTESVIQLELGLEDERTFQVAKTFPAAPSRPAIVIGNEKEIEAQAINETVAANYGLPLTAHRSLILPVETSALSFNVQNALTDYDFKVENLSIETRLEKSSSGTGSSGSFGNTSYGGGYSSSYGTEGIKATFEVLDWKNLRLDLSLSEGMQKTLGGRRIQFRIRDRERGDSDWYTIRQTFVRVPQVETVKCTSEMQGMCELTGAGLDYIAQVSVDGGSSWYPEGANTLQAKTAENGRKSVLIPHYVIKKLLLIKLRDYPQTEGLPVNNYVFTNTAGNSIKSPAKTNNGGKSEPPTGETNQKEKNVPPINSPLPPNREQPSKPLLSNPLLNNFPGMPGSGHSPKPEKKSPPTTAKKPKRKP